MRQAGLAEAGMREGEIILGRLAQRGAGGLDAVDLAATLIRVLDRRSGTAEFVGSKEHQLLVDIGHEDPDAAFDERAVPNLIILQGNITLNWRPARPSKLHWRLLPAERDLSTLHRRCCC